ncbi:MAG: RNA polymerase sigma factor [Thermoanaerobaculia bacterium]
MEDAVLVREIQQGGDQDHFTTLVLRHKDSVFRVVVSILGRGREGEAEELTQEVFLKVYRKLHQFRGDSKFSSWLYRIAYRHAVDYASRARFRAPHLPQEILEMTPNPDPEANPLHRTIDATHRQLLRGALGELPHLYRSVLHLHYWLGMTIAEISGALETPEGTVKSYMHRARAKLGDALKRKGLSHV